MEAQAERLNDRRVLLAGFLKLAMFSVIDMKMAAPVFGQYLKVSSHWLLCLLYLSKYQWVHYSVAKWYSTQQISSPGVVMFHPSGG